jgi:hypothetical protein
MGCCIGCSYIFELNKQAPGRMVAGALEQPIGIDPDGSNLELFRERIWRGWGDGLIEGRPDITKDKLEAFGQKMWGGDFVLNADEAFVKNLSMPAIVMPGGDPAHPRAIGMRVAELMPNATLLDGWKQPENVPSAIDTVRDFLKSHVPA